MNPTRVDTQADTATIVGQIMTNAPHKTQEEVMAFVSTMQSLRAAFNAMAASNVLEALPIAQTMDEVQLTFSGFKFDEATGRWWGKGELEQYHREQQRQAKEREEQQRQERIKQLVRRRIQKAK